MSHVGHGAKQDPARPQHPGALGEHRARIGHVLKHARRDHRVQAARRERQRPPAGLEPDPADGVLPVGRAAWLSIGGAMSQPVTR